MPELDLTKPLQTSNGRPVRILATDLKGAFPIVVAVDYGGHEQVERYCEDGEPSRGGYCLTNAPEPKKRIQGWVNVYASNVSRPSLSIHPTRQRADQAASPDRFACIWFDFAEGEGLDPK